MNDKPLIEIEIPKAAFLPCYYHLIDLDTQIDLLYGGRDSGKSRHIAQQLIIECLRQPYFRAVLIRKVFNTIKESMWQTIKDIATEWGIEHLFTFNASPLEIKCINGNRLICRGLDEPGNIKSIAGCNYCWIEEGNQINLDEFVLVMTSLRYKQIKAKTFISFNPETPGAYEDFWLYKLFYSDTTDPYENFVHEWTLEKKIGDKTYQYKYKYSSTWTNYTHNNHCGIDRIIFYEQLKTINPYHYNVYSLGYWHNRLTVDPFAYCFDRGKHVRKAVSKGMELYLSFDFNVNPITCGVYQHPDMKTINVIEAIKLINSDIYKLCDYITAKYGKYLLTITGDATGKNTSALVQDGINYYTIIKSKLNLSKGQIKVPSVNPVIKENRVLVNAVLYNMTVNIDPDNAKDLIFDLENVSVNEFGDIEKGNRSNPKKRADHLDHFRYYLNTFHKNVLKEPGK
jgi:phage terminase large subunit